MSSHVQLHSRCQFQDRDKTMGQFKSSSRNTKLHRFSSLDSIEEEQPSWPDAILNDSHVSAGESMINSEALRSSDSICVGASNEDLETTEGSNSGLEAACVYGPNSPRQKNKLTGPESAIVSAFMEDSSQLQNVVQDSSSSNGGYSGMMADGYTSSSEHPQRMPRRQPKQRSRARKLQYISELEGTVNSVETWQTNMASEVSSVLQQHLRLSLENRNLKQQICELQKKKIMKEAHYQYLKGEAERLKMLYWQHKRSKRPSFEVYRDQTSLFSQSSWQMLDFGKLSFGENPVLP